MKNVTLLTLAVVAYQEMKKIRALFVTPSAGKLFSISLLP
jgi:hypothetical protein